MEHKVKIGFVILILLAIFEGAYMQICKGLNGTLCCFGYEWDQKLSTCIPCKTGYYGKNCDAKCPPLFFGFGCQSPCNCPEKDCDYINGCRQLTEEQPYNFTIGLNYIVKTTELNDYEHSYNEKPNDTVVKDRSIITQTVLTSKDTAHYLSSRLMYAIIGLSVAAVLIAITYVLVYTCQLEKCKLPTIYSYIFF